MTANCILLDQLLAQYGPETAAARDLIRRGVVILADRMWRENSSGLGKAAPFEASAASEAFYAKLLELSPQNDSQRSLQARTTEVSTDINALGSVRREGQFSPHHIPGGADFLAHHHFCKLQPDCPTQCNRYRPSAHLGAVGCRGDLQHPGAGPAVCRIDANL